MVIPIPTILLTRLIVTLPLELKLQKKSIKYSHKRFSDYLSNEIISTLTASVFKESPSPEGA